MMVESSWRENSEKFFYKIEPNLRNLVRQRKKMKQKAKTTKSY